MNSTAATVPGTWQEAKDAQDRARSAYEALSNPNNCPNLRDFPKGGYADVEAFQAAVDAWGSRCQALKAEWERCATIRMRTPR